MKIVPLALIPALSDVANFNTKYFILSKVYTDEDGINSYTMVCPPAWEIIHSLKLVDYLLVPTDSCGITISIPVKNLFKFITS